MREQSEREIKKADKKLNYLKEKETISSEKAEKLVDENDLLVAKVKQMEARISFLEPQLHEKTRLELLLADYRQEQAGLKRERLNELENLNERAFFADEQLSLLKRENGEIRRKLEKEEQNLRNCEEALKNQKDTASRSENQNAILAKNAEAASRRLEERDAQIERFSGELRSLHKKTATFEQLADQLVQKNIKLSQSLRQFEEREKEVIRQARNLVKGKKEGSEAEGVERFRPASTVKTAFNYK